MNHWGYVIEQLTRVDERAVELERQHLQRSQRRTTARPAPARLMWCASRSGRRSPGQRANAATQQPDC